jgi:hypothetical protein
MDAGVAIEQATRRRAPARRTAGWRAQRRPRWRRGVAGLAALVVLLGLNAAYQVARKPTELLGLVITPTARTPAATWARYGPLFRAHATDLVRPELLAALAQTESQGDAFARTPWRWRWSWNPLRLYAPASSAVGLYQLTDAALAEARRLCIHDHRLARAGPWYDPRSCWLTWSYSRLVPSHAIELTAARLHDLVSRTLGPARLPHVSPAARERLAATMHLCGPARGAALVRRSFRPAPGERCGEHELAGYLTRVETLTRTFGRLAAAG